MFQFKAPVVEGVVDKGYGEASLRHLAKYVFPRQFALHNPFTFRRSNSAWEILPDYDDRELAIKVRFLGPCQGLTGPCQGLTDIVSTASWHNQDSGARQSSDTSPKPTNASSRTLQLSQAARQVQS